MSAENIIKEAKQAMHKSNEYMIHEFASVRTGKASPALVENIEIEIASYGSKMPLKGLATITTPEPRLIVIQPFDPTTTDEIAKGISESKIGINPAVDGKGIRLPIPDLTEERRKELVKMVKDMAEQGRVRVRSARREALDSIKKLDGVGEDDVRRHEKEIQDLTDKSVKEVDEHVASKEAEIMTV